MPCIPKGHSLYVCSDLCRLQNDGPVAYLSKSQVLKQCPCCSASLRRVFAATWDGEIEDASSKESLMELVSVLQERKLISKNIS